MRDNTLIILTSDHGEGMGRHWGVGKSTLYEEALKVPFVVATLGDLIKVRKNYRDEKHLISGIDVGRSICDYAGADSSSLPHGLSLKPLVEGENTDKWRKYLYAECSGYMHLVTDGKYKYIRGYYEKDTDVSGLPPSHDTHPTGVEQLFDTQTDPDEQHNLAYSKDYQELVRKFAKVMNEKEDQRIPLKKITEKVGYQFMKQNTETIHKRKYPKTYPVT